MVLRASFRRARDRLRYQLCLARRRLEYGRPARSELREAGAALERDGFAILRQSAPLHTLRALRAELERRLDEGTTLTPVSDDRGRGPTDLKPPRKLLEPEDLRRGQSHFRKLTNFAAVADPLLHCRSALSLAFNPLLAALASDYLGVVPAIGTLNLRKSFVNDLGEHDTLLFHCDGNNCRFLKFFFYLADVDRGGGPFCYVRGSHRRKFRGWRGSYRWPTESIVQRYGASEVMYLEARAGDVIVADTTGFHRGTKVVTADRTMLTVNYVVHPEYWAAGGARVLDRDVEALAPPLRPLADFMVRVGADPPGQSAVLAPNR